MAVPLDMRERLQLCELMAELGPDAPTLCEGWTAADLAAHLVLREHFRRWGDQNRTAEKAKGFESLLARLRQGPPLPWSLPGARTWLNGFEYFVHHEDLRRANGQGRRPAMKDLEGLCWRVSGFLGRRLARHVRPYAVELDGQGRGRRKLGQGESVVLSGPASELALYLSGRRSAAEVTVNGSERALAALRQAETRL